MRILYSALLAISLVVFASQPGFAQVPAKAEAGEVTELVQIVNELPREVLLALQGPKKDSAVVQATEVLQTKLEGRVATLKFKVDRIEKDRVRDEKIDRYRVKADDIRLNKGGVYFMAYLWVHFDPAESAKIAALKKGAAVTITGKITLASASSGNPTKLHVDVSEAKLD